uniref:Uncharacterized protein n=1 Tax=Glossina palpalis gambiensis TaxID=67801 RepID=A0A1B0AL98_9MUSC
MFLSILAKTRFIGVPSGPRTSGLGPIDSLDRPQRIPSVTMPLRGVVRPLECFKVSVFAKGMHMPYHIFGQHYVAKQVVYKHFIVINISISDPKPPKKFWKKILQKQQKFLEKNFIYRKNF